MRKGYVQMLVAFAVIIVLFVLVDLFLSSRLYTECFVSDAVALSYKMIDAVELTKLNAKLALNFSVNETLEKINMKGCGGSNNFDCNSLSEEYCTGCCYWVETAGRCQRKLCKDIENTLECDTCGCTSSENLKQDFLTELEKTFEEAVSPLNHPDMTITTDVLSIDVDTQNNKVSASLLIKAETPDRRASTVVNLYQNF